MNSIGSNNKSYNVMKNQIDELIKSEFNTTWCMEDFLEAYMRENGVEELTEEQMQHFYEKMSEPGFLSHFRNTVIEQINEMMTYIF